MEEEGGASWRYSVTLSRLQSESVKLQDKRGPECLPPLVPNTAHCYKTRREPSPAQFLLEMSDSFSSPKDTTNCEPSSLSELSPSPKNIDAYLTSLPHNQFTLPKPIVNKHLPEDSTFYKELVVDDSDSESEVADSLLGDNISCSLTQELSSTTSSALSSPLNEEELYGDGVTSSSSVAHTPCETTLHDVERIIQDFESAMLVTTEWDPEAALTNVVDEIPSGDPSQGHHQKPTPDPTSSLIRDTTLVPPIDTDKANSCCSSWSYSEDTPDTTDAKLFYRSTSLKTGKTPPGTPHRKKIVRFADALGLDLEDVKHIMCDEIPSIPLSAFSDLKVKVSHKLPRFTHGATQWQQCGLLTSEPHQSLYPLFPQPSTDPRFFERLREQKVCLENVVVSGTTVYCVIKVLNLGFEKSVLVRMTTSEWLAFEDVAAKYVSGSSDMVSDRFSANLTPQPLLGPNQRLCFAVRYTVGGKEYWDSNRGMNYSCRCQPGAVGKPADIPGSEPWIHHFL